VEKVFYDILGLVGFGHPFHPVLITMVVGPAIASFLFVVMAFFLKKTEFYQTGRQLTVVALVFWFPAVGVGLLDWFHFYGGATMAEVSIKLVLAGVLFLVLVANIALFKIGKEKPLIPLILTFAATLLVSALGYFGGNIVFGNSTQAPAPAGAVVDAGGSKELSQDGYTLAWKIRGDTIDLKLSYATNGWVGFGIGTTGTMEGSHIILGFVVDGTATVVDHFGYEQDRHAPQEEVGGKNSLTSTGGTFADGKTTLTWSMPLNTGNPRDPVLVEGQTYRVILANGGEDAQDLTSYHGRTGRIVVDVTL